MDPPPRYLLWLSTLVPGFVSGPTLQTSCAPLQWTIPLCTFVKYNSHYSDDEADETGTCLWCCRLGCLGSDEHFIS